jgi:hypothetical protein
MAKKSKISTLKKSLIEQIWIDRYGENEAAILIEYFEIMSKQFSEKYIPFKFDPIIEFHLHEMHTFFPGLTTKVIKKALFNLREIGLVEWIGKIEKSKFLIFTNHENLLKEYEFFSLREKNV